MGVKLISLWHRNRMRWWQKTFRHFSQVCFCSTVMITIHFFLFSFLVVRRKLPAVWEDGPQNALQVGSLQWEGLQQMDELTHRIQLLYMCWGHNHHHQEKNKCATGRWKIGKNTSDMQTLMQMFSMLVCKIPPTLMADLAYRSHSKIPVAARHEWRGSMTHTKYILLRPSEYWSTKV